MHMKPGGFPEKNRFISKAWLPNLFFKEIGMSGYTFFHLSRNLSMWRKILFSSFSLSYSSTGFFKFRKKRRAALKVHAPTIKISGNQLLPGLVKKSQEQ